jgi:peptide deformylase
MPTARVLGVCTALQQEIASLTSILSFAPADVTVRRMAVRKILKYPEPSLKDTALVVRNIDSEVDTLVTDMLETMYAAPGVGLAAPQVGVAERVIVLDVGEERGKNVIKLINPIIVEKEGAILWEEGCLSVVDFTENVRRAKRVLVKGWTTEEKELEIEAEDFLAVALQHEIDHLDGKLFIDRISRLKRDIYRRRVKKWIKEGVPLEDKGPPAVHI